MLLPVTNQKGIAHLFLIILLVAAVGLGVYLIGQKTKLLPRAASDPVVTDTDNDGFSNIQESFMGTDPNSACGIDAWPVDLNNDTSVNGGDTSALSPYINGSSPYNKRFDLNQDGVITQAGDVPVVQQYFLQSCTPATQGNASYSLIAPSSVTPGSDFVLKINVKTPTEPANTFLAELTFDSSKLEVTNIAMGNTVNSFITQIDDLYFDNDTGEISLLGGLPDPGFTSVLDSGETMAEVTFHAKGTGLAVIALKSTSEIISNNNALNLISGSLPTINVNIATPPAPPASSPSPIPTPTPEPSMEPSPSVSPVVCNLTNARWVTFQNPMTQGNTAVLRVEGTGCAGKRVAFVIKENDGIFGTEDVTTSPADATFGSENFASTAWIAEFQQDGFSGINNPPEYFFIATLVEDPQTSIHSSGSELKVNNLRAGEFLNGDGNKDGKIDRKDLSVLRKWWGKTGFPQEIDIDDNGVLNTFDLAGLRKILEDLGIIRSPRS